MNHLLLIILDAATSAAKDAGAFNPGDFATIGSMTTLAGSSTIIYIICGTLQRVFNWNPKWLALLLSLIFSFVIALGTNTFGSTAIKYLIAFVNGFMIYAAATGTNTVVAGSGGGAGKESAKPVIKPKRNFLTSWFVN
ncbi:hypothetical protein [Pedobacter aquatilis]|uniref:hypothetical protein n=1 Tax=Pedobacter aquatilis TaxID=351343 RepID=UPI00292E0BD7|nr:hypothetical protein [Pedobacter aquatilis]